MPAQVLETRLTDEGFKRRRYEADNGHRWSTIEIPLALWKQMNCQGRARNRTLQINRMQKRKSTKAKLLSRLLAGEKPLAISFETGLALRTLQRWKKDATETK